LALALLALVPGARTTTSTVAGHMAGIVADSHVTRPHLASLLPAPPHLVPGRRPNWGGGRAGVAGALAALLAAVGTLLAARPTPSSAIFTGRGSIRPRGPPAR
jgi:hypothetical protein